MTIRHLTRDGQEPAGRLFAGLAASLEGDSDRRAPLILLHGLTFDRTMWRPAMAELRKLDPGRQIFAVDLPGHGRSPAWPSYDFQGIADACCPRRPRNYCGRPATCGRSWSPATCENCWTGRHTSSPRTPPRGWPPCAPPRYPTCSSPATRSDPIA